MDPQQPYGDAGPYIAAMARHLAAIPEAAANDDEDARTQLVRLHREMQPALQIFLRYADLGPGDFRAHRRDWEPA